jgi:nucleoside-diphosphate-sugar epimerase
MSLLVTGATGFLGANLVRYLLAQAEDVRILVRSSIKAEPLVAQGAKAVVGDITDCQALQRALLGVDVIYHLAGRLYGPDVPAKEYDRIHVQGTQALLDCCKKQPGLRRFVHVSTTGVIGVTGDQPADERAAYAPTNAYEQTKWQAEQLVLTALQWGLPAVIVRPGLVYGPGDLHLLGFFRTIHYKLFRPIGRQPVWLHPIYIDDLTEALVRCTQQPPAVGECFHIAGQEPVTIAGLAEMIACALGTRLPYGTIPLTAARAVAAVGDLLPARLKPFAPLTRSRLDFLTNSRVYDVRKAQQELGFVAATELPVGVEQTVAWYRRQGYLPAAHD